MKTRVDIRLLDLEVEVFFFCERSIVANLWCEVVVHGALAKIICDLK